MHLMRSIAKRLGYRKEISPYQARHPCLAMRKIVGEPNVVFDVGANAGQTYEAYRRYFPQAKIYSFEPFPGIFGGLEAAVAEDERAEAFALAMGKDAGRRTFNTYPNPAENSFLEIDRPGAEQVEVAVSTVDAFCAERGIERIDILKSDTQGTDLAVLQGAEGLLKKKHVGAVYCEALIQPYYKDQNEFHEIIYYMGELGYRVFDLFEPAYNTRGQIEFLDVLFSC